MSRSALLRRDHDELLRSRQERQCLDPGLTAERGAQLARGSVPDADGAVRRTGNEGPVRGEQERVDVVEVAKQPVADFSGVQVAEEDIAGRIAVGQQLAIGD